MALEINIITPILSTKKHNVMKTFIHLFLFLILGFAVIAQPNTLKYQTIIRDANGKPLKNQSVSLECSIYATETGGTPLWSEIHSLTTNEFGLVVISLGSVTPIGNSLFEQNDALWLRSSFYLNGSELLTTTRFESVPYSIRSSFSLAATNAEYAIFAEQLLNTGSGSGLDADMLDGYDATDFLNLTNILNQVNSAGGNSIINLADPTNPQDAATKSYVDAMLTKLSDLENKIAEAEKLLKDLENKISELNNK
jgi:hypothetical protein